MSAARIAHVITESQPFGGAQRNTLLTLAGLVRDGYAVDLFCGPGGRLIPEARAVGAGVHVVDALVRPIAPAQDAAALWRLHRLLRAGRYDLVHTHSTKAGLLGRLAAWAAGVPVIIHTVHGYPFEMVGLRAYLYSRIEGLAAHLTDRVVCVGEVLRREVAGWKMAPAGKILTVYSGVDFRALRAGSSPAQIRRHLGLDGRWPVVGAVGNLVDAKAHHLLVEAAGALVARYPRLCLVIVGEGPRRPGLERLIADLRLGDHVLLLGERDDVPDILSVLDVYASSSIREGVGRALTEAMYAERPVVATAVNGVTELVHDGVTGLLVPSRDPSALAHAIVRLVADPALARRLGLAAGRAVVALMGAERMIADLERLYDALLDTQGRAPATGVNRRAA